MKIVKVEGIILSDTNYSESSKILNVYTKEYGMLGIMSKGCRSVKSKLRSVSNKFTYGYFHIYYKENGLSTLIGVDVINPLKNILASIDKISYLSYIGELIMQVLKQSDDMMIFDTFIAGIKKLEEGYDASLITNIIEVKMLNFLGVLPCIDCCSICGSTNNIVTISSESGGYVCANCYQNEKIYNDKTIKLIRLFYYVDIDKISKLEIQDNIKKEVNEFLDNYYDSYTGLYLKSKTFLKNLVKLG